MTEITAQIEIEAPAETVWQLLTDLPGYARWNPFIREASGSPTVDGEVHVRVRSALGIFLRFRARVVGRDERHALHWIGFVARPWLASGEHWFMIDPIGPQRVRFVQREIFAGIVPRLGRRLLASEAQRGFDAMNRALKQEAEALVAQPLRSVPMDIGARDARR